jgi:hypothetical protein
MKQKLIYTVEDVLGLIPISRTGLYRLIATQEIASIKHGRRRWFTAEALNSYVSNLQRVERGGRS